MTDLLIKLSAEMGKHADGPDSEIPQQTPSNGPESGRENPPEQSNPKDKGKSKDKPEATGNSEGAPAPEASGNPVELVMQFLAGEQVDDASFHSFCEQSGIDQSIGETIAYQIAAKMVRFLSEGKSKEWNFDPSTIDPQEIDKGLQVEAEHCSEPIIQKKIVWDHLAENQQYYSSNPNI